MADNKAHFLQSVKDVSSIEAHFSGGNFEKIQRTFAEIWINATERNTLIVTTEMAAAAIALTLGQLIRSDMRHDTASAQHYTDFLVTSHDHATAMSVQIKSPSRVCVTYYDPNYTTNHYRVESDSTETGLAGLSLQVADKLLSSLDTAAPTIEIYAKDDLFDPNLAPLFLASEKATRPDVLKSVIHHAASRADVTLITKLLDSAAAECPEGGPALVEILAGEQIGESALSEMHPNAIVRYSEKLTEFALNRMITPDQLCELLKGTGRDVDGEALNALPEAVENGRMGAVAAMMNAATQAAVRGALNTNHVIELFRYNGASESIVETAMKKLGSGDNSVSMLITIAAQLAHCRDHLGTLVFSEDVDKIKETLEPLIDPHEWNDIVYRLTGDYFLDA